MRVAGRQRYGTKFYQSQVEGSARSAERIVPYIMELIGPGSVCDVGCGTGSWLNAFTEEGVQQIRGLDGAWVNPSELRIDPSRFESINLADPSPVSSKFDLAISLEVAEHLPASSADRFVSFLCELSKVIVFAAAIPYQGGTGHINEQWPSYWRSKFESQGYTGFDVFRSRFWSDEAVDWWYAQNMYLYVEASEIHRFPNLPRVGELSSWPEGMIHPRLPKTKNELIARPPLRYLLRQFPGALAHSGRSRSVVDPPPAPESRSLT